MGSFFVLKIVIKSVLTVSSLAWIWIGYMVFKSKLYKDEQYCKFMLPLSIATTVVFSVTNLLQ